MGEGEGKVGDGDNEVRYVVNTSKPCCGCCGCSQTHRQGELDPSPRAGEEGEGEGQREDTQNKEEVEVDDDLVSTL